MSKTAFGVFVNGTITKLLLSGKTMKIPSVALFTFQPRHTLLAQYSSQPDGADSKFYCPPGSEEFCIAGHMPGFDEAVNKVAKDENTISNHIDSCTVGPSSKITYSSKISSKRVIPCLASVQETKK